MNEGEDCLFEKFTFYTYLNILYTILGPFRKINIREALYKILDYLESRYYTKY